MINISKIFARVLQGIPAGIVLFAAGAFAQEIPADVAAEVAPEATQAAAGGGNPLGWALEFVELGGPVILVLFGVSVIGLGIVLMKLVQFSLAHIGEHRFVPVVIRHLRLGDLDAAQKALEGKKGPVAAVMRAGVIGRAVNADPAMVREEVERVAQAHMDGLERGLASLGLVVTASPLLGLLGTVTGLVESFQQLQNAGDRVDPAILASGIWEALLTTVMGLSIAIPASALYVFLQRTVELTGQRMEDAATQIATVDLYRAAGVTEIVDRSAPPAGAAPVPAE